MKASELRIGNYFKPDSFDRGEDDFEDITEKHISDLFYDPQDDFYQPLKLTEEWLIKFGYYEGLPDRKENRTFHRVNSESIHSLVIINNVVFCGDREIKYVHTLQNVFYFDGLTGEELQIN